jgi:hypothetical protein
MSVGSDAIEWLLDVDHCNIHIRYEEPRAAAFGSDDTLRSRRSMPEIR